MKAQPISTSIEVKFYNKTEKVLRLACNELIEMNLLDPQTPSSISTLDLTDRMMLEFAITDEDGNLYQPLLLLVPIEGQTRYLQQAQRNENWLPVKSKPGPSEYQTFFLEENSDGVVIVGTVEILGDTAV
jgi:hypothetical protein